MDKVNIIKYTKRKSYTYNKGVILHGLKMIKGLKSFMEKNLNNKKNNKQFRIANKKKRRNNKKNYSRTFLFNNPKNYNKVQIKVKYTRSNINFYLIQKLDTFSNIELSEIN